MKQFEKYPAYKDSGVEWLGEIPEGWEVKRLGYLANCFPSNIDKHSKQNEKTVRLCNYTDVYKNDFITDDMDLMIATASVEQIEKYSLRVGDVLITKDSETANDIAVPAYVNETLTNVVCGYHLAMIRPYAGLIGKYLFRSFQSNIFNAQFEICSNGITRVGLGSNDLKHGLFLTPPLPEQTAIAAFLDEKTAKIDTAIAQKEQMISLLKERKQILIQNAVTKGINPAAKMKDSGVEWIGEIPEGWEIFNIGTLLKPVSIKNRADLPLLSITRELGVIERNLENAEENHNFIPDDLSGYKIIIAGQFGMNKMKAWQGSYGVSPYTGIVSPAYYVFDFSVSMFPDFFHIAIRCKIYVAFFGEASDGVRIGQWDLSKSRMKAIPFVLPPLPEQTAIVNHITTQSTKIDTSISIQQKQISKLKEYKATLIDSAVTGKIKVC